MASTTHAPLTRTQTPFIETRAVVETIQTAAKNKYTVGRTTQTVEHATNVVVQANRPTCIDNHIAFLEMQSVFQTNHVESRTTRTACNVANPMIASTQPPRLTNHVVFVASKTVCRTTRAACRTTTTARQTTWTFFTMNHVGFLVNQSPRRTDAAAFPAQNGDFTAKQSAVIVSLG